jgi:hypothetical protein
VLTKPVSPVVLGAGTYRVWAFGYGLSYLAHNTGVTTPSPGSLPSHTIPTGGTLGSDFFSLGVGVFPTNNVASRVGGATLIYSQP